MGTSSDPNGCTLSLLFAVFIVSFGLWFSDGYQSVVMNGPQTTIVKWIRAAQCSKYETPSNDTSVSNLTTADTEMSLWCRHIAVEDEGTILSGNACPQLHVYLPWMTVCSVVLFCCRQPSPEHLVGSQQFDQQRRLVVLHLCNSTSDQSLRTEGRDSCGWSFLHFLHDDFQLRLIYPLVRTLRNWSTTERS